MKTYDQHARALGSVVREFRKELNLSQGQLAKLAGLSQHTIHTVEQHTASPSLYTLHSIASAFEMTLGDLIFLIETR